MRLRSVPGGIRVEYDVVEPDFTVHVSRRVAGTVGEPEDVLGFVGMELPLPRHPSPVRDLVHLVTVLPESYGPPATLYLPRLTPGTGLDEPWVRDRLTGLVIPLREVEERAFREEWNIGVILTPADVGLVFPGGVLEDLAWRVLSRASVEGMLRLFASLAFRLDVLGPENELGLEIVGALRLPEPVRSRVLGEVRSGRPLFHPDCLRWLCREVAAAEAAGVLEPDLSPLTLDQELAARVCFPVLHASEEPGIADLLVAAWFLHEAFYGTDSSEGDESPAILELVAAGTFRRQDRLRWMDRFERWKSIWGTVDGHRSLPKRRKRRRGTTKSVSPGNLRSAFQAGAGIDCQDWFYGGWVVAADCWARAASGQPLSLRLESIEIAGRGRLWSSLLERVSEWASVGILDFGRRVIEVTGRVGTYRGLGSTPRYMRPELRWSAFLRFSDGSVTPLGLDLMVDALVTLPARQVGEALGHDRVSELMGYMFEAYCSDLLRELERRCVVVDARALGQGESRRARSADVLLGHGNEYLVLEVSLQQARYGMAAGQRGQVEELCSRLHSEGDQAEATVRGLRDVVGRNGLPRVASSTFLVVTDINIPYTPVMGNELVRQRPDRLRRFVANVEELEFLVELSRVGWGPVGLVRNWQVGHDDVSLGESLRRNAGWIRGRDRFTRLDVAAWLSAAPVESDVA